MLSAVRVLLATPGVDSARPIPLAEVAEMLEPWLGAATKSNDLPLPRVIDVQLEDGAAIDTETLSAALDKTVPGASVEDHEAWRNTLILLFRSVEIVAIVIIFLIGTVAFAAIVFTTRSVLAVHQEIVEALHLNWCTRQLHGRSVPKACFPRRIEGRYWRHRLRAHNAPDDCFSDK